MSLKKKILLLLSVCLIPVMFDTGLSNSNSPGENTRDLTITFAGDIMLGRQVGKAIQKADDPSLPFRKIWRTLASADISIGNLECVFVDSLITGTYNHEKILFPAYGESAQGLKLSGFDFCSLANNHAMDYGIEGVRSTIHVLEKYGIYPAGISDANPAIFEKRGLSAALFAFWMNNDMLYVIDSSIGYKAMTRDIVYEKIMQANRKHDIVILFVHWGEEYTSYPDKTQIHFARHAAQLGADFIIGHGPHQIQGYERYGKSLIVYSLGNCVFDQKFEETQTGLLMTVRYDRNKELFNTVPIPIFIPEISYVPELTRGIQKERILSEVSDLSANIGK